MVGGGGIFEPQEFVFSSWHEYFLGLIGVHEFFPFNFPLHEYFFLYFESHPPLPHKFYNGPSLIATRGERKGEIMQILNWQ